MFYSFVVAKTHVAEEVAGRSEAVHAETKACNVLKGNVVVEQRRQLVKNKASSTTKISNNVNAGKTAFERHQADVKNARQEITVRRFIFHLPVYLHIGASRNMNY